MFAHIAVKRLKVMLHIHKQRQADGKLHATDIESLCKIKMIIALAKHVWHLPGSLFVKQTLLNKDIIDPGT